MHILPDDIKASVDTCFVFRSNSFTLFIQSYLLTDTFSYSNLHFSFTHFILYVWLTYTIKAPSPWGQGHAKPSLLWEPCNCQWLLWSPLPDME